MGDEFSKVSTAMRSSSYSIPNEMRSFQFCMMASAVSDMTVQDDGSGRRFCSLDDVANLGSSTTLQGSQSEQKASIITNCSSKLSLSFGLKYSLTRLLQVHFFGRDDKHHLSFDEFSAFVNAIQREVLRAEFLEYSRGLDKVVKVLRQ